MEMFYVPSRSVGTKEEVNKWLEKFGSPEYIFISEDDKAENDQFMGVFEEAFFDKIPIIKKHYLDIKDENMTPDDYVKVIKSHF